MMHAKINALIRRMADVLAGTLLALPLIAGAGPNPNSVADVAVCLESAETARVCSSKELSNVVLQCDGDPAFHKDDDLDDTENPFPGLVSPHEGLFTCPDGNIVAVFVKSGSLKFDGNLDGLPSGAGEFFFGPDLCPADFACPTPSDEGEDEELEIPQ